MLKGFSKIFRFTLTQHIKTKGYRLGTLLTALLLLLLPIGVMSAVEYFGGDSVADSSAVRTIALVDEIDGAPCGDLQLAGSPLEQAQVERYASLEEAENAADAYTLIFWVRMEQENIEQRVVIPDGSALSEDDAAFCTGILSGRYELLLLEKSGGLNLEQLMAMRIQRGESVRLDESGQIVDAQSSEENSGVSEVLSFALPYVNIMLLYFMVLAYGQSAANSVIAEKSSKLMDTFLLSVNPIAMVFGKVLATVVSAVMQLTLWIGALVGGLALGSRAARALNPDTALDLGRLLAPLREQDGLLRPAGVVLAVLILLAGFVLYCALASIGGSICEKQEDLASANMLFSMVLVFSFMATIFGGGVLSGGAVPAMLHFVPFTSILVTPSMLVLGKIPLWEGACSLVLTLGVAALIMAGAGKLYRMMALYKGNPPKPGKLLEMLHGDRGTL